MTSTYAADQDVNLGLGSILYYELLNEGLIAQRIPEGDEDTWATTTLEFMNPRTFKFRIKDALAIAEVLAVHDKSLALTFLEIEVGEQQLSERFIAFTHPEHQHPQRNQSKQSFFGLLKVWSTA